MGVMFPVTELRGFVLLIRPDRKTSQTSGDTSTNTNICCAVVSVGAIHQSGGLTGNPSETASAKRSMMVGVMARCSSVMASAMVTVSASKSHGTYEYWMLGMNTFACSQRMNISLLGGWLS
uniref:Uncharacterized protein n=1 Tax=Anopheles atroparvus TaxID=41427 RepID=A0A182JBU0_ANOAO